jgi:hypothetical protein
MTTSLPIIDRLCSMFTCKSSYDDSQDPLRELMFLKIIDFVERKDCFNTIMWSSIDNGHSIKDCISDAHIYISNDRKIQVNKIIEAELVQNNELFAELTEELNNQDNYYLKLIVEHRKYIFN